MSNEAFIVLIPYYNTEDFYEFYRNLKSQNDEDDYEDEENNDGEIIYKENWFHLPINVETTDEKIALMAVAYDIGVNHKYFTHPSSRLDLDWQEMGYPGTLKNPSVELPSTNAPVFTSDFLVLSCADMTDWKVITPEEMINRLKQQEELFVLDFGWEPDDELWDKFDDWSLKFLNSLPY